MTTIARLQAENYKRLTAVEIIPGEGVNFVPIIGKNAQGKSSVLDAITAALGGKSYMPTRPVRKGEEEGAIRLELSNGLVVRRIFAEDGTGSIVVENGEGARYPSPQAVLDKLYSSVAFDPIAFTRLEPKQQLEQLRRLVKLDVDVDDLAAKNKADYGDRRDVNREVKTWEGQLAGFGDVGEPGEPIDTSEIERAIQGAAEHNGQIERRKASREAFTATLERNRGHAQEIREQIAKLQEELTEFERIIADQEKQIAEAAALPEPVDVSELTTKLSEAQTHNRRVERAREKVALQKRVETLQERAAALTKAMEERDQQKAEALARANMPVHGLSFGDGEVLFNDLPLDQASTAEQLRISTAIGMATAPELRVMLVRDASLLDQDGFALLAKMATEGDFQFWVEAVDTGDKVGIIMEDGAVKGAPAPEPIDKGKRRTKKQEETDGAQDLRRDGAGVAPSGEAGGGEGAVEPAAESAVGEPDGGDKQPWVKPEVEKIDPATLPEQVRQDLGLTADAGAPEPKPEEVAPAKPARPTAPVSLFD